MSVIQNLYDIGLTDLLLPFLLIFSIVFAILNFTKIFQDNRKINTFLALAIALIVVIPHITGSYPPGADVVQIMNSAIPNVSGVVIAVVMFLIILGIFGISRDNSQNRFTGIVTLLAIIAVFIIFGSSAGWFDLGLPSYLSFLEDQDFLTLAVVLLVFWIIIQLVTAKEKGEKDIGWVGRSLDNLGSGFKFDYTKKP